MWRRMVPPSSAVLDEVSPSELGSATILGLSVPREMLAFKTETKKVSGENIQPSVIEPSFGLGRIMYDVVLL
jgi:glycyl-tRNA synthetase (class II)